MLCIDCKYNALSYSTESARSVLNALCDFHDVYVFVVQLATLFELCDFTQCLENTFLSCVTCSIHRCLT